MAVEQQRFQRLWGDLQHARGMLEELLLLGLGHIAVPAPDRDVALGAEVVQAQELVVDERLEGRDVERSHRGGRALPKLRQDGKEGRLGLARCGGGGEQDVVIRVEDGVGSRHLHGAQVLPIVLVDEVLNKGRIPVKDPHGVTSLNGELGKPVVIDGSAGKGRGYGSARRALAGAFGAGLAGARS